MAQGPYEDLTPNPKAKLLDQVREVIRFPHLSIRREHAYVHWIKQFIFFHQKRHPKEMGAAEIERFLTHLAVARNVAASSCERAGVATGGATGVAAGQHSQALLLPQLATQLCHAFVGSGVRVSA